MNSPQVSSPATQWKGSQTIEYECKRESQFRTW